MSDSSLLDQLMDSPLAPCAVCGAPACDIYSLCGHTTCGCTGFGACPTCKAFDRMLHKEYRPNAVCVAGFFEGFEVEILSVKNYDAEMRMNVFGSISYHRMPVGYFRPL